MKRLLFLSALLVPMQASALEYSNLSLFYTDAPFTPAEAAGISLLTSLDAITGNPDGSFQPNRTLNRAEFLKIALKSHPKIRISRSDEGNCFPDVYKDDWFSPFVCLAKKRGMVSGYPDGTFKPGRSVNYAEAVKMLSELYEYVAYSAPDEPWYAGYMRAAQFNRTAIPATLKYDRALTRGQMARLAAAFRAHHEEELEIYRMAEKNLDSVIALEIANRKMQMAKEEPTTRNQQLVNEPEDSGGAGGTEEELRKYSFPARSRILVLGQKYILGSSEFVPRDEPAIIRSAQIKFKRAPKSIGNLWIVDERGNELMELRKTVTDTTGRTWQSFKDDASPLSIPPDGTELGVLADVKNRNFGGVPEELIQMKWISLTVSPYEKFTESYQLLPTAQAYPAHQTAQAYILSVKSTRPSILDLKDDEKALVAEVQIEGGFLDDTELRINELTFTLSENRGVNLDFWKLTSSSSDKEVPCGVSAEGDTVSCPSIPASVGLIDGTKRIFKLYARMLYDEEEGNAALKVDLLKAGVLSTISDTGEKGAIRWSDGSGQYHWIDLEEPLAEGAMWK